MTTLAKNRFARRGFTLLEILMAIGIMAVLLAAAIPFLGNIVDPADEIANDIRLLARKTRVAAIETGEPRRLAVTPSGLAGADGESATVPPGWLLEIRRFEEARFRKPLRQEYWEFNGAGICEPITLRLSGDGREVLVEFDPLTALEPPHEL